MFTDTLASRLETEQDGELAAFASLCYVCSGNVERLVHNWLNTSESTNSPLALQVEIFQSLHIEMSPVTYAPSQAPYQTAQLCCLIRAFTGCLGCQGAWAVQKLRAEAFFILLFPLLCLW